MFNILGRKPITKDADPLRVLLFSQALPPATTSGGFGKILVIHANDGGVEVFDVTAAGLTAALAAADSGDAVWVPPCTLIGNWTVPAGVGVQAYGKKSNLQATLTGVVTLSNGSFLNSMYVNPTIDSGDPITGIIGPTAGVAYLNDCSIIVTNEGAGNAYGVSMATEEVELRIWSCWLEGDSAGGSGYAARCTDGVIKIWGGRAVGSTNRFTLS